MALVSKLLLRHILLLAVLGSLLVSMCFTVQLMLLSQRASTDRKQHALQRHAVRASMPDEELQSHWEAKVSCRFHTCFDINNCSVVRGDKIEVYVYPEAQFIMGEAKNEISLFLSVEYQELVEAVKNSRYYQANASKACVFIPPVDTMSQDSVDTGDMSLVLHSLP